MAKNIRNTFAQEIVEATYGDLMEIGNMLADVLAVELTNDELNGPNVAAALHSWAQAEVDAEDEES